MPWASRASQSAKVFATFRGPATLAGVMIHRLVLFLAAVCAISAQPVAPLFDVIERHDLPALKRATVEQVNAPGALGLTPLMYAAAFGRLEAVEVLLERGAEINAKDPRDGTALMYGTWDPARTKLLIAKGADVNAASKLGRTALLVAAGAPGGVGAVQLLLQAGANPLARDKRGFNLLIPAAAGDAGFAGMLIDKGFDVKTAADGTGFTPLMLAAGLGNLPSVKLLLAKGADVNASNTFGGRVKFGDIALKGLTPLMLASPTGSPELIETLIAAGANVNAQDSRGMTPLMFALSTENQNVAAAKVLIAAGAKLDIKSTVGETAADWVRKFQHPSSLNLIKTVPVSTASTVDSGKASPADSARAAAERSVALLGQTSRKFFQQAGCGGCHHAPATLMAFSAARAAGVKVEDAAIKEFAQSILTDARPVAPGTLQRIEPGGTIDTVMFWLVGLAAAKYPADVTTNALVSYLATAQMPNGAWDPGSFISRAPVEETVTGHTAFAIRALKAYPLPARQAEFADRLTRARKFLVGVQPKTTYEHAEKLLGLTWSGASTAELAAAAQPLIAQQRRDGGFSQNPHLSSDAYATGIALWALYESGVVKPTEAVYQRGAKFLVSTQRADGSWYVASRSPKFQPYFESGFPYGHDQWISSMATAYATIALAPVGPDVKMAMAAQ